MEEPEQVERCARCGGTTRAADGSCNGVLRYDLRRGGVPVYCQSTEFETPRM